MSLLMLKIQMVSAAIFLLLVVFTSLSTNTLVQHIVFAQIKQQQQHLTSLVKESSQSNSDESLLLSVGSPPSQPDRTGQKVPNQYIVVLNDNASKTPSQAAEEAKDKGAQVLHIYESAVKGFSVRVSNEHVLEAIIKNNPDIDYVEPDVTIQMHGQTDSAAPLP
jgi:hypothetical protein